METWVRSFTDGNVIVKILVLQAAVAALVLFLLKKFLDRELFIGALEKIAAFPADQGADLDEVVVVSARKLSGDDEFRLRAILKGRFPGAVITVGENRSLWGGVVVRAGRHIFDFSLGTRIIQLLKLSDT
jgi:F0F1-type ATP synthase delta subunit